MGKKKTESVQDSQVVPTEGSEADKPIATPIAAPLKAAAEKSEKVKTTVALESCSSCPEELRDLVAQELVLINGQVTASIAREFNNFKLTVDATHPKGAFKSEAILSPTCNRTANRDAVLAIVAQYNRHGA